MTEAEQLKELLDNSNTQLKEFQTLLKNQETKSDEAERLVKDLESRISDLQTEIKNIPLNAMDTKSAGEAFAVKMHEELGGFIRGKAGDVLKHMEKAVAALNLTNAGEGGNSVDEVLSREIIERARKSYVMPGACRFQQMPRDDRQEVTVGFPTTVTGIENVAGADFSFTDVQRYAEIVNKICKISATPRITDEAMYGSDLDLYAHLLDLLDEEFGIALEMQILFGDGDPSKKNMRGILSSKRVDITASSGKSWLPTFATDPANARPVDFFPAHATGVSAKLGATDKDSVNYLIDLKAVLPTKYLSGAKWYMNRKTYTVIEKMRDDQGDPVFRQNYRDGTVFLLNHPIVIDDYLPDIAANSYPIIFGDLFEAFQYCTGAIDKMQLNPYIKPGCTVVEMDKEYYEKIRKNDAIVIAAATANATS